MRGFPLVEIKGSLVWLPSVPLPGIASPGVILSRQGTRKPSIDRES
jgi:hypothetical protein